MYMREVQMPGQSASRYGWDEWKNKVRITVPVHASKKQAVNII